MIATKLSPSQCIDQFFLFGGREIGQKKIAFISKQVDESELESTINWYFSLFSIQAANDRMVSFLDQLDLPNLYRRVPDRLHTLAYKILPDKYINAELIRMQPRYA